MRMVTGHMKTRFKNSQGLRKRFLHMRGLVHGGCHNVDQDFHGALDLQLKIISWVTTGSGVF